MRQENIVGKTELETEEVEIQVPPDPRACPFVEALEKRTEHLRIPGPLLPFVGSHRDHQETH